MNAKYLAIPVMTLVMLMGQHVLAQTSSLAVRKQQAEVGQVPAVSSREEPRVERNAIYDRYSWITVKPAPPKTFEVGDLLTIIVRETRKFEADADLETKKEYDVKSELEAFIDLTGGGLGSAAFQRGKPAIDYKYSTDFKGEADTSRKDRLTTRITGKIIDVKPNGLLVLEAKASVQHDEEISVITLTGTCRKEDVTADNTILSTQIADKSIVVANEGALRVAASRGWILRLIDVLKPF